MTYMYMYTMYMCMITECFTFLQILINVCMNILLSDETLIHVGEPANVSLQRHDSIQPKNVAPPRFCSAVIKLAAMQMQALGVKK